MRIESITQNISSAPLTGSFVGGLTIDGATFVSAVTSSTPGVTCTKGSPGERYNCIASSVTMQPNTGITITAELRISPTLTDGSRVRITSSTAGFGRQVASATAFITVRGKVREGPDLVPHLEKGAGTVDDIRGRAGYFYVSVTNIGTIPTLGQFETTTALSAGLSHLGVKTFTYDDVLSSGQKSGFKQLVQRASCV